MRFKYDHDLHIHSYISACSKDAEQTPERILQYAKENGLHTVCLTDHFWDENVECLSQWNSKQPYSHISQAKPLPQSENVKFLFGCETELDFTLTVGLSKERMDEFVNVMIKIYNEATSNPEKVISAPHNTPVKKIDETLAARKPDLNFKE